MAIVGIIGRMQSGKDTVGKIWQYLDYCKNNEISFDDFLLLGDVSNWKVKRFGDKLKQVCSILTGIPVADFEKEEVKQSVLGKEWNRYQYRHIKIISSQYPYHHIPEESMTVRQLLQEIGTDAIRNCVHPDAWINALFADYIQPEYYLDGELRRHVPQNWIITDVRFMNEAESIVSRNGILLKVNRLRKYSVLEHVGTLGHASETELDNINTDNVIDNNSDIDELIKKVNHYFKKYNY